jgi:hypothetical protein
MNEQFSENSFEEAGKQKVPVKVIHGNSIDCEGWLESQPAEFKELDSGPAINGLPFHVRLILRWWEQ